VPEANAALEVAGARGLNVGELSGRYEDRMRLATAYEAAYKRYSWPVSSVGDLWLVPFHVMATRKGRCTWTRITCGTWRHWGVCASGAGGGAVRDAI